jgi:hypothetical protein
MSGRAMQLLRWHRQSSARTEDREAEIEAAELSIRAKRKLGQLIIAAGKAGALAKGGGDQRSNHRDKNNPVKPTLASAHVDKNLANSARKLGKLEPEEFDLDLSALPAASPDQGMGAVDRPPRHVGCGLRGLPGGLGGPSGLLLGGLETQPISGLPARGAAKSGVAATG